LCMCVDWSSDFRKTTTMREPEWQAGEQYLLIHRQQQQTRLRQGLLEPLFAFISGVGDDVIVLQKGAGPKGLDRSRCCLSPTNGPASAPLPAFLGDAKITCHVEDGCVGGKDLRFLQSEVASAPRIHHHRLIIPKSFADDTIQLFREHLSQILRRRHRERRCPSI
jgi:hypothetical protein